MARRDLDERIMARRIEIGNESFTIGDLFVVDETNISDAFATQAARYAYISLKMAETEGAWVAAKAEREEAYNELAIEYRRLLTAEKGKVTEGMVQQAVNCDEEYVDLVAAENELYAQYKMLRAVTDALRQRGEMLVSLGATLRQEYEVTGARILETRERLRRQ